MHLIESSERGREGERERPRARLQAPRARVR